MKRLLIGLLWLFCLTQVEAQTQSLPTAPVTSEDYQRIEADRIRESANFAAQEAACYQRFAVNDCLKKVQSERIAVMADFKRQESTLHARERQQQGAQALERIEQKTLEQQQKQDENQSQDSAGRVQEKLREQEIKQAEHAAKAASDPGPVSAPAPTGPTAAERVDARTSYERKQVNAEKKRLELIKRQAEKGSKPARPLPDPP